MHSLFLPFAIIDFNYFYILNFFHVTTSKVFLFKFFEHSLFSYLNFHYFIIVSHWTLFFILNCNVSA